MPPGVNQPMLGIEAALQTAGPRDGRKYYEGYSLVKDRLTQFEYVNSIAKFPGGNDHGPKHIQRVLEKLNHMLSSDPLRVVGLLPVVC